VHRRGASERNAAFGFLTPSLAGLTIFVLFPSLLAIVTSLFNWPTFGNINFIGLRNYADLFSGGSDFPRTLLNTAVLTLVIVPVNLVVTLGMAFWIARSRVRQLYRVLFFLPVVTPTVATSIIWKMLYQPSGPVSFSAELFGLPGSHILASGTSALIALIILVVWQGFGYNMLIFSAAIDQLPPNVLEAAMIDGANGLKTLLRIKIPLVTPSIFFATTISMIQTFQIFAEPFVMTAGGPGISTTTVVMQVYQKAFSDGQLGAAAAPAMILFLLILVVTIFQWVGQKKWVHYE
jgi:multiple sugar transport system permease protein